MELVLGLVLVLFSLTVHEFAHGWMASLSGDDTARSMGRLTLNPLSHIDPFGTIVFPLILFFMKMPLFGWAKPVPIDPRRMKHPRWDAVKVAAAGPAANLLLAGACAFLMHWGPWGLFSESAGSLMVQFFAYAALLNILLAVFNLLPVHPLDGGNVLEGFIPRRWWGAYRRFSRLGPIVLILLLVTNSLHRILWPLVTGVAGLMGIYV